MVIVRIHLLPLLLWLPALLFSAEFIASVSRNEVGLGQGVTLELTLNDASAKAPPSIESLKKFFNIHSQQSISRMRYDGKASSSHTWTFTLVPHVVGDVQIPSITIESSDGILFTQPIEMRITHEKKALQSQPGEDIRFETEASNLSPYKNEPFFLTVKLITHRALANVQAEKFEVEGGIVELAGEPHSGEMIENGVKVAIVEFKYLITPMKSGSLTIPSIPVHGGIPQKRNSRSAFDARSLLDDSFDPFALIQGFSSLQPFTLSTKPLEVEIRPPVSGLTPWLPAKGLEIRESWDDSQVIREGEVFTRSFVIAAVGVHSSQLLGLEGKQDSEPFKIYADKPELKDELFHGRLKSYRIEQYTLIPQKSGEWTLPEMMIDWWDTEKGEKREARVPARKIQVLPAVVSPTSATIEDKKPEAAETPEPSPAGKTDPLIFVVMGVLAVLLAAALLLLVLMQRKMKRLQQTPAVKKIEKPKREPAPILPRIKTKIFSRRTKDKLDDLNPT
jgi:BatD DUF11 like domain